MPNCFSLTRKADPKAGPVKFVEIDEEICRHLNVPCDPKLFYRSWYDIIGFSLACGRTFADIRKTCPDQPDAEDLEFLKILDYLDANYVSDAWARIGKG